MQASGYADIDIVEAAVSLSLTKSTTLMDRIYIYSGVSPFPVTKCSK